MIFVCGSVHGTGIVGVPPIHSLLFVVPPGQKYIRIELILLSANSFCVDVACNSSFHRITQEWSYLNCSIAPKSTRNGPGVSLN